MSARSHCVTCGIVAHAALRCSAVLRRTARIGWRSTSPHREKSGSGTAAAVAAAAGRRAISRFALRLHVVDRDAAVGPGARHFVDVDAEFARQSPHRGRSGRRRLSDAGAVRARPGAAADVDDLSAPSRPASARARRSRSSSTARGRLSHRVPSAASQARAAGRGACGVASAAGFAAALPAPAAAADSSTVRIDLADLDLVAGLDLDLLRRVPATDEGTSMVALSVSSSRTGCSLRCVSPALTSTRRTSPAATFSPSSGSVKSVTRRPRGLATDADGMVCAYASAGLPFSGSISRSAIALLPPTVRVQLAVARERRQRGDDDVAVSPLRRNRAARRGSRCGRSRRCRATSSGRGSQRSIASGSAFT